MSAVKKLASQLRDALLQECAALDPEAQSKFLLNAGWELFDDITWKVQAFLLGKAIWQADGKLAQLLHEELGADFATQTKNLEMLGFPLCQGSCPLLYFSLFSGGRDRTMTWDIHLSVSQRC